MKTPLSPHYIVNKRFTISILHDRVSPNSRHCVPTASSIFAMAFQITKKKRKRSHSGIDMGGKQYSWNKAKHVQLWLGCSQGLLAAFFLGIGRDVHHYHRHHHHIRRTCAQEHGVCLWARDRDRDILFFLLSSLWEG